MEKTSTKYQDPRGSTSSACKVQIKLGCKPGCCPARGGLLTKCQGTTGHVRCVSNIWEPNCTLQIFKSQGSTKMRVTHFLFTADGCRKNLLFGSPILRHPGNLDELRINDFSNSSRRSGLQSQHKNQIQSDSSSAS